MILRESSFGELRCLRVSLCLLLCSGVVFAQSSFSFKRASDLQFPLYRGASAESIGSVRIGMAQRDFQRRGFYRIGVLPDLAFYDVTLSVLDEKQLIPAFDLLAARLAPMVGERPIHFRRFKLVINGSEKVLEASELIWRSRSETITLKKCSVREASGQSFFPAATFQLRGPQAGLLSLITHKK